MKTVGAALAGLSVLLAGPASADTARIDHDRLDQRLAQLAAEDEIVGLAVAVIEGGEIVFARGYGVTAAGEGPVTQDTVFRWASLSKGVATSLVTRMAVEERRFALTSPVAGFGTTLRLPGRAEQTLTLEDLMAHRVGVVSNAYDNLLEDGRDPATIRRMLGSLHTVCPVRQCHSYQNVAFDALTEIVEGITGETYDAAVSRALFQPLRMSTASTGRAGLEAARSWAKPHTTPRGATVPEVRTVKEPYYRVPAAGGVNGSVLDLARFAVAQMGLVPNVLPPGTLEALHLPRVATPREQSRLNTQFEGWMRDARYGLGWRTYTYHGSGQRVVKHRGSVEGYRALMLFDPQLNTGVVALWNSNSRRPVGIELEVMDMAYGLAPRDWLGLDGSVAGAAK
jgi:beta-lactamase class C